MGHAGDIIPGTLDVLVLKTVSDEPMHGYDIANAIHTRSDEVLRVEEGALYPALHRLELRGWVTSDWGTSEHNRRAKYYRLTPAGRQAIEAETLRWKRMFEATTRVLEAP